MKITTICCALLLGSTTYVCAQEVSTTEPAKHEKQLDHYIGVQLNGLIRQVINLNNNTSTTPVNPYLVTYTVNHARTGWGARIGVGYQYNSSYVNDGITTTDSKINDMQLRLGVERRFNLSGKWSAGAGLDVLYNSNDDYTKATVSSVDTITTVTKSKLPAFGGGVMAWLRYKVSDHVLVGTESSFYYIKGTEDREVEVTRTEPGGFPPFSTTTTVTTTRSKPVLSDGSFKMPVVFYLIVRM